jgi:hypothetical protein
MLPGAGRKPGTPNKSTLLKREAAVSAIETFRTMGVSLPELGAHLVNVLNAVALAEIPEQQVENIKTLTPGQRDRLAKYCKMGVEAIAALMEFAYPKLARIDLVGDTPAVAAEENRYKFVLNIADAPGRPVIDNTGKNGSGAGQAQHDD